MTGFIIVMLILIFITMVLELTLTAITLSSKLEKIKKDKNDRLVERAAEEKSAANEAIDEGFENIMSYSVNGKTGFEVGNNGN